VTITGGTVNATGGNRGAGIGTGSDTSIPLTVEISGGVVTARGGGEGAGIGGGDGQPGGTITITGGTVTATGAAGAAGIGGGGRGGAGGSIRIAGGSGGIVTATAGVSATHPIGAGKDGAAGVLTLDPAAIDSLDGLTRTITFPAGVAESSSEGEAAPCEAASSQVASVSAAPGAAGSNREGSPVVRCVPAPLRTGATATCTVTGGDPGIDIFWHAAYNPVFAAGGVTLDSTGSGTFSFTVPASALGEPVTVELVDWSAPVSIGVAGGPVPASVPAGEGPVSVWSLVMVALAGGLVVAHRSRAASPVPGRG
jgi:hypothetical protein